MALDLEVHHEAVAGRPDLARGLQDAAEVGVGAVQRGLDERRVGDRARDGLDGARAAANDDARHPPRALAVGHDLDRELAQQRVDRLAEHAARRRSPARPPRPRRRSRARTPCRWWTAGRPRVMRSKERFTHTPVSRSRVSASSAASVCDEAEHRREARRDHARRPSPARRAARVPRRQRHLEAGALGPAVARQDRAREVVGAVAEQPRSAVAHARSATRSRGSSMPITPVDATPTCAASTPSASAAAAASRARSRARAGRRRRSSSREFATTARRRSRSRLARHDHRRADARVGGEARGRHRVRLVADTARPRRAPVGLSPAATPAARKPAGSAAGRARVTCRRRVAPSGSGRSSASTSATRPSVSSEPQHQVEVLHRLAGGALPEVVDRGEHQRAPGGRLHGRVDAADVGVAHVAHAGRPVRQLDERLAGVGVLEAARSSSAVRARSRRHVAGREQPLVERQQVRR